MFPQASVSTSARSSRRCGVTSSRWRNTANSTLSEGKWIAEADKPSSIWYRTVTYNMILIACNTGMRPVEMKNLRWRDIMPAKDREGREIVVCSCRARANRASWSLPRASEII
jgi:integrase